VGFAEMKLGILTISQGLAPSWSSEPIQIWCSWWHWLQGHWRILGFN
jgi:hypothetical protein